MNDRTSAKQCRRRLDRDNWRAKYLEVKLTVQTGYYRPTWRVSTHTAGPTITHLAAKAVTAVAPSTSSPRKTSLRFLPRI
ncbi:hypothetical protein [Limosilactobacillus fermentum]|uniref:hypothetical protein n=1 Tax=Limosilactobacillus fermentum TaxID=1613 RepID=UPI000B063264|nr:hypothetical protein [Limosilactobacillus fermentum]